ncbi:MAG: hypothetical protein JW925_04115 [Syntrophaceae bacterium]|nr:hypothetical protein [Syntrophaceae bacterium]
MSKCKAIIQRFVEKPESIQDAAVKKHLDECPKCKALFTVLVKGASENMPELVDELTQQERMELLTRIRRQENLLLKRDLPRKKRFFFKREFAVALAGVVIVIASWLSLHHFLSGVKQKTQIREGVPASRKMELLIQSDSRPRLYLEIEYFPENES